MVGFGVADPLVSIIIPAYNYARYLDKALTSCREQTYKHLEIIVIDDGSTDNTRDVVARFPEVVYLFQQNRGVSAARNNGLARATGAFIAFLDADDYLLPESVALRVELLKSHPDVGIIFTDTYSKAEESDVLSCKEGNRSDRVSTHFYEDLLLKHLRFQTSAAMIRADLAKAFSFPEHLANGEDLVYFTKVFFAAKGYFLARPAVVNVHHGDSLRHNVEEVLRQDTALVDTILTDPYYRGALDYMRRDLMCRRHLDLFRRLYLARETKRAREHYLKAILTKPASLFELRYLSKAIRSFFR